MRHLNLETYSRSRQSRPRQYAAKTVFGLERVQALRASDKQEALDFLKRRPVHTVVMTSFIRDNGIESVANRGKFYGYRNGNGALAGVALLGHTTLIETGSNEAVAAFALTALRSNAPVHIVMSNGETVENFWKTYAATGSAPRLTCDELLFELSFPYFELGCDWNVRVAEAAQLAPIAEAHAAVAFAESGIDPLQADREGFLKRTLRRIEQRRTFVVFDGDKLVFKADIAAETSDVMYLEGIYVAPERRGQGIASCCLSKLSAELLCRAEHICLLSNVELKNAHRSFLKAGFKNTDCLTTIFV